MERNGYRYHGLATIRSFLGFPFAVASHRTRRSPGAASLSLTFKGGRRGRIEEPYSRYEGRVVVAGSAGTLTDDPELDGAHSLVPLVADGEVIGFRLLGHEITVPVLETIRACAPRVRSRDASAGAEEDADERLFAELKTCGLIRVLESLWSENVNSLYTYRQALYDHLTTAAGRHLPVTIDPAAAIGRNFVGALEIGATRRISVGVGYADRAT